MQNKELFDKYQGLKDEMCAYVAKMIANKRIKLDWTFQSVNVKTDADGYGVWTYHLSEVFVEDGTVYIRIDDIEYPPETEETPLSDESMDVVFSVCEKIETLINVIR